jgi:hypothetical protein
MVNAIIIVAGFGSAAFLSQGALSTAVRALSARGRGHSS